MDKQIAQSLPIGYNVRHSYHPASHPSIVPLPDKALQRRNHGFAILILSSALSLLSLSYSDDSDPVKPVTSNLDTDRAVQVTIGAGGGNLEVTDAVGTVYRLEVPVDALSANTTIIATPFKMANTGNDMTPLGPGIRLQPAGLVFEKPSSIVVTLPQAPAGDVPLLLHRTGNQPGELLFATVDGAVLTTKINHFSDVTPVSATVQQLLDHWEMLMGLSHAG